MGGASSSLDGVYFRDREEYMRWPLQSVRGAVARWQALSKPGTPPKFDISRRQFWDVFTDYETLSGGAFLSLPMAHFDVFDANKAQRVFAPEILVMLALFCNGSLEKKIQVVFQIFDFAKASHLTLPDMVVLLQAVTQGSAHLGITKRAPSTAELTALSKEMFSDADVNLDGQISFDEFVSWSEKNLHSQALLRAFSMVSETSSSSDARPATRGARYPARPRGTSAPPRRYSTGAAASLPPLARAPSPTAVVEIVEKSMHEEASFQTKMARQGRRSSLATRTDTTIVSTETKQADTRAAFNLAQDPTFASVKTAMARTRAAKLSTIANRRVLNLLVHASGFTLSELRMLAQHFTDASNASGTLDPVVFHQMLKKHFPGLTEDGLLDRVHAVVDVDGDGCINFRDLVLSLSIIIRGNLTEKMRLLFNLYDRNKDGRISIVELIQLLRVHDQQLLDLLEFSEEVLVALDANGDRMVSREEFAEKFGNDPIVHDVFSQVTAVTPAAAALLHALRRAYTKQFTLEILRTFVLTYRAHPMVNSATFWAIISESFSLPADAEPMVEALFGYYDYTKVDKVSLRDVMMGFAQILAVSPVEHSGLVFDIFDTDGSCSLDGNEILHMMIVSHRRVNERAHEVLTMLERLDTDHDGYLSLDEFVNLASRQPLLMETLQHMFATRGEVTDILKEYTLMASGKPPLSGRSSTASN